MRFILFSLHKQFSLRLSEKGLPCEAADFEKSMGSHCSKVLSMPHLQEKEQKLFLAQKHIQLFMLLAKGEQPKTPSSHLLRDSALPFSGTVISGPHLTLSHLTQVAVLCKCCASHTLLVPSCYRRAGDSESLS